MSSSSPSTAPDPDHEDQIGVVRTPARTAPRPRPRRTAAPLAKAGMLLFAIGLLAIFADMILFAAGTRDLPLWVNLTAMLAPVGLGLALIAVVRENRESSPALAARGK